MSKISAAFEGVEGSHSDLVLKTYFETVGLEYEPASYENFRQVASAVVSEKAEVGVFPIDNSIAGTIREGYDLLGEYNLDPVAEVKWRMEHLLLGVEGAKLSEVEEVLAHPIVIGECGKFLSTLFKAKIIPWSDTGKAAKEIADSKDVRRVCIAPPAAAENYGLVALAENIADHPENYTRFLLFRSPRAKGTAAQLGGAVDLKDRKTSLVLTVSHQKGSLAKCLDLISEAGINMTKIESRPRPGKPFEIQFYIDLEGDRNEEQIAKSLDEIRKNALELKVIGSYDTYPAFNSKKKGEIQIRVHEFEDVENIEKLLPESHKKNWPKAAKTSRPDGTALQIGPVKVGGDNFVVMAGPCSVESRDQVMSTAEHVHKFGATLLRGGAFKPRTNPYSFQGLGWDGVALLAEAGRANGMPIVSEVMSLDQVERMSRECDVLQIGARNMQNYDLLRAIGQVPNPVLLKRGLSASLDEFLSAAEYVLASGNPNVMLCERGIRTFETSTRFTLDLNAVPVLRERTHLPIIIDPSHGVGVRRWIRPLCRAAKAVGAHGIIIEVHPNPPEAKSDKDQALTFNDFIQIMEDLERIPYVNY